MVFIRLPQSAVPRTYVVSIIVRPIRRKILVPFHRSAVQTAANVVFGYNPIASYNDNIRICAFEQFLAHIRVMTDCAPIGFARAGNRSHFDNATGKIRFGSGNMRQDARSVTVGIYIRGKRSRHIYIRHCSVIEVCDYAAVARIGTYADKRNVFDYAFCADSAE